MSTSKCEHWAVQLEHMYCKSVYPVSTGLSEKSNSCNFSRSYHGLPGLVYIGKFRTFEIECIFLFRKLKKKKNSCEPATRKC